MLIVRVGSLAGNVVAQLDRVLGELAKTANAFFYDRRGRRGGPK